MNYQEEINRLLLRGCCTEAMVELGLVLKKEENPLLVQASSGLCIGMHSALTCGALTGGCMLLSMFDRAAAARVMIPELTEWFDASYGMEFGSVNCEDLREHGGPRCRTLIAATMKKCIEILQYNGLLEE